MNVTDIAGATALVTGASRGFGRGIATSLVKAGARVVGVARDPEPLRWLRDELGGSFIPVAADAAAPVTAGQLIDAHRPAILVLSSGAALRGSPLSGGYAGAKAAIRFLTAYAARQGVDVASFLAAFGPTLTIEQAGAAITTLITEPGYDQAAYLLTAAVLTPIPA